MSHFGEKLKTREVFDIINIICIYIRVLLCTVTWSCNNIIYLQNIFFDRIRVIYSLEIKVTTGVRLSPQLRNDKQSIRNDNPAVGH